jgi:hypothetical protein
VLSRKAGLAGKMEGGDEQAGTPYATFSYVPNAYEI